MALLRERIKVKSKIYTLDGDTLSSDIIAEIIANPSAQVRVSTQSIASISRTHSFLGSKMKKNVIYGVNTGFGPMASHIIGVKEMRQLQANLIRSHATGIGDPIHPDFVLAAMLVRLNTLAKGYSGISKNAIDRLTLFINNRIIPIVPEHGAVGTSGDLVQLAHIALALIGEGEVYYRGTRQPTKMVLKKLGLPLVYALEPKEGLSFINGTSVMAGITSVLVRHAERILEIETLLGALALELINAFSDPISSKLHELRPHAGQIKIASKLRALLSSSRLLQNRKDLQKRIAVPHADVKQIPEDVQEVYSFRCIPQILGPILDTLLKTKETVETELNSVTDNPIVDASHEVILHGGNFHGDYVATAIDQLKAGIVKLTLLSERRINFFLNRNVNRHFPAFLNLHTPGLTLALQGLQFVATSTAAQSQTLAYPHSIHTISTNADNQDIVSMGTDAALIAAKVIENAYILLAIELITLMQAVDVREEKEKGTTEKLSQSSKRLFREARKIFPKVYEDRVITQEFNDLLAFLKAGKLS